MDTLMASAEHHRMIDVDSHLFELSAFLVNSVRDEHGMATRKEV